LGPEAGGIGTGETRFTVLYVAPPSDPVVIVVGVTDGGEAICVLMKGSPASLALLGCPVPEK